MYCISISACLPPLFFIDMHRALFIMTQIFHDMTMTRNRKTLETRDGLEKHHTPATPSLDFSHTGTATINATGENYPTMVKWFRSEEMEYISLIVNQDAAHDCLADLGRLGVIQFTDVS